MAFRAGARVANMEFIQFHPTSLYGHRLDGRAFLITEAVRGEGGLLKTQDGKTFMERYHEWATSRPRDVVARAIDAEMKKRGEDFVLLDMTHLDPERVSTRFPNIYQQCLKFGIDIIEQPIPVVPAAHYVCGGIRDRLNGQTSIPGLFAAGECACSGLHGANRLASNSLLEALVLAERAAKAAVSERRGREAFPTGESKRRVEVRLQITDCRLQNGIGGEPQVDASGREGESKMRTAVNAGKLVEQVKATMSRNAAIVRSDHGLNEAWMKLEDVRATMEPALGENPTDVSVLELRNMVTVARLIVRSAQLRKESRGLHFNTDYPGRDDVHFRRDTILTRQDVASGST